ncbi:MAG: PIN domain-containing protein [Deltaproteobacteria bacterium]
MKVMLDTDIFVSSFLNGQGRAIIDLWAMEKLSLCLCRELLTEYIEALKNVGLEEGELKELLRLFSRGHNINFSAGGDAKGGAAEHGMMPHKERLIGCASRLKPDAVITVEGASEALRNLGVRVYGTAEEFMKDYNLH